MSRVADIQAGTASTNEAAFADYVADRTIACVAPGPISDDEHELIRQHDLIYIVAGHTSHHRIRPDIVFLNRHGINRLMKGRQQYDGYDWIVTKSAPHDLPNARKARYGNNVNLNQVPIVLEDLAHFRPADVNVYGADLYYAGPGASYLDVYDNRPVERQYRGIISHRPTLQHEYLRRIWQQTGWLGRSDRLRQVLEMDTDDYYRGLRAKWVPSAVGVAA